MYLENPNLLRFSSIICINDLELYFTTLSTSYIDAIPIQDIVTFLLYKPKMKRFLQIVFDSDEDDGPSPTHIINYLYLLGRQLTEVYVILLKFIFNINLGSQN